MAQMFPKLSERELSELDSRAEAQVYRACRDQLPEHIIVQHSLPFLKKRGFRPIDGEADFVVFDQERGILMLEVKGGGIALDPRTKLWTSIDRNGDEHKIKDPFEQAMKAKKSLRNYLNDQKNWFRVVPKGCTYGHAVFFPDVKDGRPLVLPGSPIELIGVNKTLVSIDAWINGVFTFWHGQEGGNAVPGEKGEQEFRRLFCQEIIVRPLLSVVVAEDEKRHLELTSEQAYVLRLLRRHRKAAVSGGAGTGKTLLALEKARECAAAGQDTLFLCYNRALGEHLKGLVNNEANLLIMNFHQYCRWRVQEVNNLHGTDYFSQAKSELPKADIWDVLWPYALALAIEAHPRSFDAIIVDEGQDFKDDFWMPVELSLVDKDPIFYVFFDENQSIYTKISSFPFTAADAFPLTTNCRNTKAIHECAYAYYKGEPVDPPPVTGQRVEYLSAPGLTGQGKCVGNLVLRMIQSEGLRPEEVVVLVGDQKRKRQMYQILKTEIKLPKPALWAIEEIDYKNGVTVDTIARFKGLEAAVVILWIDGTTLRDSSLLYVGLSRAKSKLYVIGDANVVEVLEKRKGDS